MLNYVSERADFITVTDSRAFFAKVLEDNPEYIALDTETYHDSTVGAKDGAITLWIKDNPNNVPFCTTAYYNGLGYFMMNDLPAVELLFKAPVAPLMIGHNIKYDLQMWANIGVDILYRMRQGRHNHPTKIIADTMTMIHAVNEEHMCKTPSGGMKRSKALKNLAYHYLDGDAHVYEDLVAEVRVAIANYYGVAASEIDYYMVCLVAPEIMKDYACADVEFTYKLYPIIKQMLIEEETVAAYEIDMGAMIAVLDMQRLGVKVNKSKMVDDEGLLKQIKSLALEKIREILKREVNPDSSNELAEAIEQVFGIKWEILTEKGELRIDKTSRKMFATQHPETSELLEYVATFKKAAKILSTYIYNTLSYIQDDGRVHAEFNINPNDRDEGGTVTGRLSASNPNLQNVPKKIIKLKHPTLRDEFGEPVVFTFNPREYYISDDGSTFVFNDYDAQEYSVLGHYSQDRKYIAGLNAGRDIHKFTYSEMYNIAYELIDDAMRQEGKTLGFSVVYQIGNPSLAVSLGYKIDVDKLKPATRVMYSLKPAFQFPPYKNPKYTLDMTLKLVEDNYLSQVERAADDTEKFQLRDDYKDIVAGVHYYFDEYVQEGINHAIVTKKKYFENFPEIKTFLDKAKKVAAARLWVKTFFGRKRHIQKKDFAYAMPNAIIQGTCADVMKLKLYALWLFFQDKSSKLILSIHDEVGWSNTIGEEHLRKQVKEILEDLPFRVKITVGTEIATDWGHKSEPEEDESLDE